jgi:Kdo2-lipid A phosphotransferase
LYEVRYRWKAFFIYHLIASCLLGSWLWAPTRLFWDSIDLAVFRSLNSSLAGKPFAQIFWALANYKPTDLFGAFIMASVCLMYVFEVQGDKRRERLTQFFYLLVWGEVGIFFTKQLLGPFLHTLDFRRESPSLLYSNTIMLSEAIPWLKIKDIAPSCFPGDHAEIVLNWNAFIFFFCGWRYGLYASLWTVFFILPRLIAGAYWFSDAVVGSISIICVLMAWATATPLYGHGMNLLYKLSGKIIRK